MSNQSNNNTSITENNQGYIDADREQPIANEHNSTASAGIPVIANGAKCTCTGASDPSAQVGIVALSQAIVRVNEGSLLAATTNDMTVDAVNFGTCKITRSACTASIQWENAYADTQILGSLQILTMNSTGMCRIGGKIEFTTCGQSERVTPITTEDIISLENQQLSEENIATSSEEIYSEGLPAPNSNHLADLGNSSLEDPIIEILEAGVVGNELVAAITPVTYPQSKLGGTVKQPKNLPCTFKGAASGTYHWKIRDESMSVLKEANGAGQITIRFPKKGRYVIEAYQRDSFVKEDTTITDIDTKSDKFINALIVNVVDNELVLKANQTECITGGSVTIAVEKLFNTLDIDAGQISYRVLSQGIPLADSTQAQVSGNSNTATAKFDTKGSYVISGTSSRGTRINPTESIEVKNLSVKEVTAKGEKQYKARKGETFELKAVLKSNDTPENQQKVKWEVYYSETENGNKTKCYPIVGGAILNNKPPVSLFTQAGFYFIYAFCATSKTESVKAVVEICEPKFVSTVWKDLNGNNIQEIGKREAVYANIKMKGVSGLSLKFEVYSLQTNKLIEEMSIAQIQSNKAICKFQLSDNAIKELQNGNKLYIKPIVRNSNIVLANENKAPSDYPITYTVKEKITSLVFYADKDCKKTIASATYGNTIYARVLTRNLTGRSIYLMMDHVTEDKLVYIIPISKTTKLYESTKAVGDDGSVIFEITTSLDWKKEDNDKFRAFVFETQDEEQDYVKRYFELGRDIAQIQFSESNASVTMGQNKTITTVNQVTGSNKNSKCDRCSKELTVDEFKQIFTEIKSDADLFKQTVQYYKENYNIVLSYTIKDFVSELNKMFLKYKINTCRRKAYFLANIYKETGGLLACGEKIKETNANRNYANKNGNGDENSGDGFRYRGRGIIQLTGKTGYKRYGNYIDIDFLGDEKSNLLIKDIHYLVDSAGWFWEHGQVTSKGVDISLNSKADVGNFKRICELIQGDSSTFYDAVDGKTRKDWQRGRKHILQDIVIPIIFKDSQCPAEKENNSLVYYNFHIYHNGTIEKQIPEKETFLARYYYHEANGTIHYLGVTDFHRESWKPTNGTEKKKDRTGNFMSESELTHYKNISFYSSSNVKFKVHPGSLESHRYYVDIDAFACQLGALLECNIQDLRFNGFSSIRGESIGGSTSHTNGTIGDYSYFSKEGNPDKIWTSLSPNDEKPLINPNYDYDREVLFCEALYKFGYARFHRTMLTENVYQKVNNEYIQKKLPHCSHYAVDNVRHYHHLHIQGLKLSGILTIKPI